MYDASALTWGGGTRITITRRLLCLVELRIGYKVARGRVYCRTFWNKETVAISRDRQDDLKKKSELFQGRKYAALPSMLGNQLTSMPWQRMKQIRLLLANKNLPEVHLVPLYRRKNPRHRSPWSLLNLEHAVRTKCYRVHPPIWSKIDANLETSVIGAPLLPRNGVSPTAAVIRSLEPTGSFRNSPRNERRFAESEVDIVLQPIPCFPGYSQLSERRLFTIEDPRYGKHTRDLLHQVDIFSPTQLQLWQMPSGSGRCQLQ